MQPLHTLNLLNNAQTRKKAAFTTIINNTAERKGLGEVSTCENVVNLLHHQVGVLRREAHGGLKFEHVAMRSIGTQKDVLLL